MPALALSEIKARALAFSRDWADASSERAEAQTFWNEFFHVFGIHRRSVASFERKVENLGGRFDRIDVFYSGVMLGEHKSRGADLSKAASQAFDYIQSLTREKRDDEIPRYIVLSDFARIVLYDLDAEDPSTPIADFPTKKLHEHIRAFGFLSGYQTRPVDPESPINITAVEKLGALHDALERGGYTGHDLERFLVRILFCLFADDTAIFEQDIFKTLIRETREDGSDLGPTLARLFKVLDTDKPKRAKNLPEELAALPYVNGQLFHENLQFAEFDAAMRAALVECCDFHWANISPAVFGSLFQSIMAGETGKKKRRQIGAHYTSERDILKLIRSLFLDDLHARLAAPKSSRKALTDLHDHIASLKFLDPACGCGNFLVIAYRELRLIELEILRRLHGTGDAQRVLHIDTLLKVQVDQMHGIEIEEWPARIAEVAMWLIDHQMNQMVSEAFGEPVLRLPLTRSAKIAHANALRTDWNTVLPAKECAFVLGNPPFVGKKEQNADQKADMEAVWGDVKGAGLLDYVTCWYRKAKAYIRGTEVCGAFVSTNSICQGEQVGILWRELLRGGSFHIRFAHNTFPWQSEARGAAHVHVVIIGFGPPAPTPRIWDYSDDEENPTPTVVSHISPYLVEGPDVFLIRRSAAVCTDAPEMSKGSEVTDDGHLLLEEAERQALESNCLGAREWIREFTGGDEFINGDKRYCLWLKELAPSKFRDCREVRRRLDLVRQFRSESPKARTRGLAATPHLFGEDRQPTSNYLLLPKVSSQAREYIPIGFLGPEVIVSGSALVVPSAGIGQFGVLSSAMHNAWMRRTCGRMKSDYQYSVSIVYNNFPWPQDATDAQKKAVESAAQSVLDARAQFPDQTLADLYDPLAMPKPLRDAHKALDRAVDKCYRSQPFTSERQRVEYLFGLYLQLTAPLAPASPVSRAKRTTKKSPRKRSG